MYKAFNRLFQFTALERCNRISVICVLMIFVHTYQIKRFLNSNIFTTFINIDTYHSILSNDKINLKLKQCI